MSAVISHTQEPAPVVAGGDQVAALLTRASTDPNFDAQKFEVAVKFIIERESKQARRAFNDAMAATQSVLRTVPRNAKNDHLRSRYATLDGMLAVILPISSQHGLNIRFGSAPASQPGWQCVTCIVTLGDHEETTALEGPIVTAGAQGGRTQMTGIQATGSTTTYLKRYLLGMVFALVIADEQDDDGEASRRTTGQHQRGSTRAEGPDPKAVAWKDKVVALMGQAQSEAAIDRLRKEIASNYAACRTAWPDMAAEIDNGEYAARERIRGITGGDQWDTAGGTDPIAELIAEVEAMETDALDGLASNAAWRAKVRDLFPLDAERLQDAIATRRAELK